MQVETPYLCIHVLLNKGEKEKPKHGNIMVTRVFDEVSLRQIPNQIWIREEKWNFMGISHYAATDWTNPV